MTEASRRSPRPAWATYTVLAVALTLLLLVVLALDGTFPEHYGLIHVMLPAYSVLLLPSVQYRDDFALRPWRTAARC